MEQALSNMPTEKKVELHTAIIKGETDKERLKKMVNALTEVEFESMLVDASTNGKVDVLKVLSLRNGFNVDKMCINNFIEMCANNYASIREKNSDRYNYDEFKERYLKHCGKSLLENAVKNNQVGMVEYLLDNCSPDTTIWRPKGGDITYMGSSFFGNKIVEETSNPEIKKLISSYDAKGELDRLLWKLDRDIGMKDYGVLASDTQEIFHLIKDSFSFTHLYINRYFESICNAINSEQLDKSKSVEFIVSVIRKEVKNDDFLLIEGLHEVFLDAKFFDKEEIISIAKQLNFQDQKNTITDTLIKLAEVLPSEQEEKIEAFRKGAQTFVELLRLFPERRMALLQHVVDIIDQDLKKLDSTGEKAGDILAQEIKKVIEFPGTDRGLKDSVLLFNAQVKAGQIRIDDFLNYLNI